MQVHIQDVLLLLFFNLYYMFTIYFRRCKPPCTRVQQTTSHIWKPRHNTADQHGTGFLKILPTSTKGG